MRTAHTIGLPLGGLDDETEVGHISGHGSQLEGEGFSRADDGGCSGGLNSHQRRRRGDRTAAAGDDPIVETGEQVGAGNLGSGAEDSAALLAEGELFPQDNLIRTSIVLGRLI